LPTGDATPQQQQQQRRITSQDGGFLFSELFSGTYQLTVTSLGYQQAGVRVEVPQASPLTIMLTESADELQAVEIVGRKEQGYKNTSSFSGTKTETPVRYVPQAISYVTKEVMEDQQAFKVGDVLKNISGTNHFSYYNNDIAIRGYRASNSLVNGLRTPTNSWSQPLLPNVERIEVIKGPASA